MFSYIGVKDGSIKKDMHIQFIVIYLIQEQYHIFAFCMM